MCSPTSVVSVLISCLLVAGAGAMVAAPSSRARTVDISSTDNLTQHPLGPDRCLTASSPLWCIAEEFGTGLARSMYPEVTVNDAALSKGTAVDSFDMLTDLAARSFDLGFSSFSEVEEEGRGKRRRKFTFLLVAFATLVAVLLPFKLKAIALLAGTALMVGKIALVVASLVGLKKLVHSKQSDETTHVHYSGHRSDPDAHQLAYSEYVPQYTTDERY